MVGTVIVSGRQLGRNKPLFADWSMPIPPGLDQGEGRLTLRDLITQVVRTEIDNFRQRQEERRVFRVLTARQVSEGATHGKIASGGSDLKQQVNEEHSVAAAIQAFEDGLYFVIIDDQQARELDSEVFLQLDSRVTFLRLTMLAGG